jgi:hypothetical protein
VEALDGLAWADGVMELSVPATAVERPPGGDGTVDAPGPPWAQPRCRREAASDRGGVQRSAGLGKATVKTLRPGHAEYRYGDLDRAEHDDSPGQPSQLEGALPKPVSPKGGNDGRCPRPKHVMRVAVGAPDAATTTVPRLPPTRWLRFWEGHAEFTG